MSWRRRIGCSFVRTNHINTAIAEGTNRFEICLRLSKGVRRTHKKGARLADSISSVLEMLVSSHGPSKGQQPSPDAPATLAVD